MKPNSWTQVTEKNKPETELSLLKQTKISREQWGGLGRHPLSHRIWLHAETEQVELEVFGNFMPKLRFICKTKEHFTVPELEGSFSVLYGLRCIFHDATGPNPSSSFLTFFIGRLRTVQPAQATFSTASSVRIYCMSGLNKQTASAAISPLRGCLHYILAICTQRK